MITAKEKREINREFREKDESHKWPISGRFNVTERAIREARMIANCNGEFTSADEYRDVLENICSRIVNDPENY